MEPLEPASEGMGVIIRNHPLWRHAFRLDLSTSHLRTPLPFFASSRKVMDGTERITAKVRSYLESWVEIEFQEFEGSFSVSAGSSFISVRPGWMESIDKTTVALASILVDDVET